MFPLLFSDQRSCAIKPLFTGDAPNLNASGQGFTGYAVAWDGFIDVPVDGGYTAK